MKATIVSALTAVFYVLLHTSITVPALSLVGLVAWAVFATLLAFGRRRTPREQLRRYRGDAAGVLS